MPYRYNVFTGTQDYYQSGGPPGPQGPQGEQGEPGVGTDELVKHTVEDATAGYLDAKLASDVPVLGLKNTYSKTGSEPIGSLFYDTSNKTVSVILENSITLQLGQEMHIYGKNISNANIVNGQPVAIAVANGQFTAFTAVDITTPAAYAYIGVATHNIDINAFGFVTINGLVRDINTNAYDEGKPVYVGANGLLTKTFPTAPNYIINVGIVEYKHGTEGRINIISSLVPRFADLSDVNGTALDTTGQIAVWNNTAKYFDFTANITNYVPYTGASSNLVLGANSISQSGIVFPETSGLGIKFDIDTPVFGWKDLVGAIVPRVGGAAAPAFTAFRGTKIKDYAFQAGDVIDQISYHMPHDYVPGTNMFIHFHWGHNGTAISGTLAGNFYISYCKGYNQAGQTFNEEITIPFSISITNVTGHPRWAHHIYEVQFTHATPDTTHLDVALMEVDGLIRTAFDITTIPTITGSATSNLPYVFFLDIHYQSTGINTKGRNFPFYA